MPESTNLARHTEQLAEPIDVQHAFGAQIDAMNAQLSLLAGLLPYSSSQLRSISVDTTQPLHPEHIEEIDKLLHVLAQATGTLQETLQTASGFSAEAAVQTPAQDLAAAEFREKQQQIAELEKQIRQWRVEVYLVQGNPELISDAQPFVEQLRKLEPQVDRMERRLDAPAKVRSGASQASHDKASKVADAAASEIAQSAALFEQVATLRQRIAGLVATEVAQIDQQIHSAQENIVQLQSRLAELVCEIVSNKPPPAIDATDSRLYNDDLQRVGVAVRAFESAIQKAQQVLMPDTKPETKTRSGKKRNRKKPRASRGLRPAKTRSKTSSSVRRESTSPADESVNSVPQTTRNISTLRATLVAATAVVLIMVAAFTMSDSQSESQDVDKRPVAKKPEKEADPRLAAVERLSDEGEEGRVKEMLLHIHKRQELQEELGATVLWQSAYELEKAQQQTATLNAALALLAKGQAEGLSLSDWPGLQMEIGSQWLIAGQTGNEDHVTRMKELQTQMQILELFEDPGNPEVEEAAPLLALRAVQMRNRIREQGWKPSDSFSNAMFIGFEDPNDLAEFDIVFTEDGSAISEGLPQLGIDGVNQPGTNSLIVTEHTYMIVLSDISDDLGPAFIKIMREGRDPFYVQLGGPPPKTERPAGPGLSSASSS